MLTCFYAGLLAAFAHAAASAAPQKTRSAPSKNATRPDWNFQAPDRSAQNVRWRESISATLQQTTFAPATPAGRYLQHNATISGKRLPPARMDDLDAIRPPEHKQQRTPDGKPPVHGEFTKHSTSWRPQSGPADTAGAIPALREERRAAAYADFHLAEDVELKLGPEYQLGTSTLRPEQTGHCKDNTGALGMGMQLKIDF